MEILATLVALLAALGAGAGYWAEQAARQMLLTQLDKAEVLEVRIQSQPNYRLLNGQAERLLVAGRGLYRAPFPRLELLELETDPVAIDPAFFPRSSFAAETAPASSISGRGSSGGPQCCSQLA